MYELLVYGGMSVCYWQYDISPKHSLVQTLREHRGWVVNVHMQQYSQERSIVSCRFVHVHLSRFGGPCLMEL